MPPSTAIGEIPGVERKTEFSLPPASRTADVDAPVAAFGCISWISNSSPDLTLVALPPARPVDDIDIGQEGKSGSEGMLVVR